MLSVNHLQPAAMTTIEHLRKLWEHACRADESLLRALESGDHHEAVREYGHILGAAEIWLSRLQSRPSRTAVWPENPIESMESLREQIARDYRAYLSGLREEDLPSRASYTNSAGQEFADTIEDILFHVIMHGQYHRGKVNLLLRQSGEAPAPADYIAFVRGVPAAAERRP